MNNSLVLRPTKSFLLRLIGTLVALGLLVYLLRQQGWEEISAAIQQLPFRSFLFALGAMMLSRLAVTARWHILLVSGGVDISLGQTTRLTFAGLFASNFLPTTIGGDVVRLAGAIQLKYDGAICAASLVADRLIGMAGMAFALPFGIPSLMKAGLTFPRNAYIQVIGQQTTLQYGQTLIAGQSFPEVNIREVAIITSVSNRLKPIWDKGLRLSRKLLKALTVWIKKPGILLIALGITFLHQFFLFGSIWLLIDGMGEETSFWLVAGLWSFVYFVTLIPISINGYGLQEVSMAFLFSNVGGVSPENGLTLALLVRTLFMLASLPGAAFIPGILSSTKGQTAIAPSPQSSEQVDSL